MNRRQLLIYTPLIIAGSLMPGCSSLIHRYSLTIIQLPQQHRRQMMGYILISPDKNIIVVDGGKVSDAPLLTRMIQQLGGRVSHWLLTHPHDDHIGAFSRIITNENDIKVDTVHGSFPPRKWVKRYGGRRFKDYMLLTKSLEKSQTNFQATHAGQKITGDGYVIEVLSDINPEITKNAINNSSIVYRMHDFHKSILFLGDLGVQGGKKLLRGPFAERVRAEYVQMAHHGQRGVDKEFYEHVRPSSCLWPAPLWLYNNNSGTGINSGPWDTLNVRQWMEHLGVTKHYVAATGIHKII